MKRSSGITVIAILSLLGSVLILLTGILAVIVFKMSPPTPSLSDGATKIIFAIFVVLFIAPAIWGVCTSIGLFRLREWSRISILIFSALLALGTFFLAAVFVIAPLHVSSPQPIDSAIMHRIRFAMAAYYLLLAAIGVWWFVFFTRKSVVRQFAEGGIADTNPSTRPVSITIIAWYSLVAGAFMLPYAFLRVPAVLFTYILTGTAATLLYLAIAAIHLYIGIGLLRLDPRTRVVAIAYHLFPIVNVVVFYLSPNSQARMQRALALMPWSSTPTLQPLPFLSVTIWISVVFTAVIIGLILYFLITRKPAFYKSALLPAHP